jgi:DNA replication and repair protein RecF
MKIADLKLTNFRSHKKAHFIFDDNITLIEGPNGIGKTNILEAIHVLSTGKSPRAKYDRDLIEYNSNFSTLAAHVQTKEDDLMLDMQIIKSETFENASTKRVKVNKVPKTIAYFCGVFNSVLFTPEDIQLITGSPSERRKYLDAVLTQTDNKYKKAHSAYIKALHQRNKILEKLHNENKGWDEIEFWTHQLLEQGLYIQEKRKNAIEKLEIELIRIGAELNPEKPNLKLNYKKSLLTKTKLDDTIQREISAKTTLIGPHRDDFEILFDNKNIGEFGSRGEQRSIILALKLAEINFIEHEKGERPVLLLDDVFSELDETHRKAVMDVIENQQSIITSAEKLDFLKGVKLQKISL